MSASPLSNSGERAAAWRAPLAITVAGWLLFETLSGLLILFLPFGLTPQFTVVVHTGVGCLFLLPYLIYQVQHWSSYRSSAWTHVKLTEYVAFGAAMVCVVSGVVLTVQALVGTRIGYAWDLLHTVGTFALLAAAVPHVVTLMLRVWGADLLAPLIAAQQRWIVGTAGFTVLGLIGVAVCIGLYNPRRDRWFASVKCRCCKETSIQPIVGWRPQRRPMPVLWRLSICVATLPGIEEISTRHRLCSPKPPYLAVESWPKPAGLRRGGRSEETVLYSRGVGPRSWPASGAACSGNLWPIRPRSIEGCRRRPSIGNSTSP